MRALCEQLDWPQRRYRSLHVVGTNGKSSVTTMTAALLEESGLRSGACISPHVWRWSERTRIDGREIDPGSFARAIETVAAAIVAVEASSGEALGGGERERVTQFEAAIAASFVAFADAGVEVAVVEAGLGGRLDATNVIPSTATALTSIGLDHVEWLGATEAEIATEKLAVLRPGSTLVIGDLPPDIAALARSMAAERGATLIAADPLPSSVFPPSTAPYLRRNAAVAATLAETVAEELSPERIASRLATAELPGRAQFVAGDPPLIADAAHNEAGARALAEALPDLAGGRPVFGCLSVLADKDAAAIAAALAPRLQHVVCTSADPGAAMGRPGAGALDAAELSLKLAGAGVGAEAVADPQAAIARTLELARGRRGVALFAGSHYLLRYLWNERRAPNYSR